MKLTLFFTLTVAAIIPVAVSATDNCKFNVMSRFEAKGNEMLSGIYARLADMKCWGVRGIEEPA